MTHNTKVEEVELLNEIRERWGSIFHKDTYGNPTWECTVEVASVMFGLLHHQLQKARQDWLREEIVKLEVMKKKGQNGEGLPFENSPEIYGNARMEAWKSGHNQAIQTIIDRYQSELDQDNTTTP